MQGTPAHPAVLLFLPGAKVDDAHCHLNKHEMAVKSACLRCLIPLIDTRSDAVGFPGCNDRQLAAAALPNSSRRQGGILAAENMRGVIINSICTLNSLARREQQPANIDWPST